MSKPTLPPHWTECRPELQDRLARVPRLLVATDFDGTLAPICELPGEVSIPEFSRESLTRLSAQPGVRVAVLSGRELEDVARLVGLPQIVYAGNHGLEIKGGGMDYVHPGALAARPSLDAAETALRLALESVNGSLIEHKGLSLSVHYRNVAAADLPKFHEAVALVLRQNPLLVRRSGKKVEEFRPDVKWDKGSALKRLMKGLGLPAAATLYMGDDTTDEDAFAVLGGPGTSLHVGERPDTQARFRMTDPRDVSEFLRWLVTLRAKG